MPTALRRTVRGSGDELGSIAYQYDAMYVWRSNAPNDVLLIELEGG